MPKENTKKTIIVTYTGRQVDLLEMPSYMIDITDIAHALSLTCRFNGHCRKLYSVAEHCVRAVQLCTDFNSKRLALLHDAPEAYIGDFISPLKNYSGVGEKLKQLDTTIMTKIIDRFSLFVDSAIKAYVKHIDSRLILAEMRDLFTIGLVNPCVPTETQPAEMKIRPWSARKAKREYLKMARKLHIR